MKDKLYCLECIDDTDNKSFITKGRFYVGRVEITMIDDPGYILMNCNFDGGVFVYTKRMKVIKEIEMNDFFKLAYEA